MWEYKLIIVDFKQWIASPLLNKETNTNRILISTFPCLFMQLFFITYVKFVERISVPKV